MGSGILGLEKHIAASPGEHHVIGTITPIATQQPVRLCAHDRQPLVGFDVIYSAFTLKPVNARTEQEWPQNPLAIARESHRAFGPVISAEAPCGPHTGPERRNTYDCGRLVIVERYSSFAVAGSIDNLPRQKQRIVMASHVVDFSSVYLAKVDAEIFNRRQGYRDQNGW